MPAPLNPNLWPSVLHDEDGIPISPTNPLPVTGGGGGGGSSPNQPTFRQGQVRPAAAGSAEAIPAQAVPNGFQIFGRAFVDNNDTVYIGRDAASAQDPTVGFPLEPGAFFELALTSTSAIFVNSLTTGDGIFWYVEAAS